VAASGWRLAGALHARPSESTIALADRDGVAPIDLDEDSPGVSALVALVDRLAGAPVPA